MEILCLFINSLLPSCKICNRSLDNNLRAKTTWQEGMTQSVLCDLVSYQTFASSIWIRFLLSSVNVILQMHRLNASQMYIKMFQLVVICKASYQGNFNWLSVLFGEASNEIMAKIQEWTSCIIFRTNSIDLNHYTDYIQYVHLHVQLGLSHTNVVLTFLWHALCKKY